MSVFVRDCVLLGRVDGSDQTKTDNDESRSFTAGPRRVADGAGCLQCCHLAVRHRRRRRNAAAASEGPAVRRLAVQGPSCRAAAADVRRRPRVLVDVPHAVADTSADRAGAVHGRPVQSVAGRKTSGRRYHAGHGGIV